MAPKRFEFSTELPVPADQAYTWHTRPGALERLMPPWEDTKVLERRGDLSQGTVVLEASVGPIRMRWVSRHRDGVPGRQFVDEQVEGPFTSWVHTHLFEPIGTTRCRYIDRIDYEVPFGGAGELAAGMIRSRLERVFRYRHAVLQDDLAGSQRYSGRGPLAIGVTGATGLIGRSLVPFLTTSGHRVRRVVRTRGESDDILWDPASGRLDSMALEGLDAVVHLAGESIASGRWTDERRRRILDSRIQGTTLIAETIGRLTHRPRVLVSASAIGIYGDRGDEILTEEAPLRTGTGALFVERVGQAWEAATVPAERAGIRVVRLRTGLVLTPAGGALGQMLPPFRAGIGGRLGNGRQYMSWISIDDMVGAIYHTILTDVLSGPVNATTGSPVTNADFSAALGAALSRPALLPVPATALRLLFGEMANELLLASTRVVPDRLEATGYLFRYPTLSGALRHVLGR